MILKELKKLLKRVEHLETLMRLEYIPRRFDACYSCKNGVPCLTNSGEIRYSCIKDVKQSCGDFIRAEKPEQNQ